MSHYLTKAFSSDNISVVSSAMHGKGLTSVTYSKRYSHEILNPTEDEWITAIFNQALFHQHLLPWISATYHDRNLDFLQDSTLMHAIISLAGTSLHTGKIRFFPRIRQT
jgi:hypothetical protein